MGKNNYKWVGARGLSEPKALERGALKEQGSFVNGKTEKNKLTFSLDTPHIPSSSCDSPEQRSVRGAAIREESVSRVSGASRHFFVAPLSCLLPAYTAPSGKWVRHLPVCCSDWSLGGMDAAGMQPSLACRPQPFVAVRLIPLAAESIFWVAFNSSDSHGYVLWPSGQILPQTTSESLGD